jgi:hypothetical protein
MIVQDKTMPPYMLLIHAQSEMGLVNPHNLWGSTSIRMDSQPIPNNPARIILDIL